MATIIVEDGSGVAGANSYNTEAELTTYAADRGVTLTAAANVLLVSAMDDLESRAYKGEQLHNLQWPRSGLTNVAEDEIPANIKQAQLVAAIGFDQGKSALNTPEQIITSEKTDVITVTYSEKGLAAGYNNTLPLLNRLLKPYLNTLGRAIVPGVWRG